MADAMDNLQIGVVSLSGFLKCLVSLSGLDWRFAKEI